MKSIIFIIFIIQMWIGCLGLFFGDSKCWLKSDEVFYDDKNSDRILRVTREKDGSTECYDFKNSTFPYNIYVNFPTHCVKDSDEKEIKKLLSNCTKVTYDESLFQVFKDVPLDLGLYIYPGTLWCGAGNISTSPEDLGSSHNLDACCREHDNCPDFIPVGESKHGITNDGLGTYSACSCDDKFYNCLKSTHSTVGDNVGFLFFDFLGMPCYKKDYPIKKCLKKGGFFHSQCEKYELDKSKSKVWELFDPKVYYPSVI